MEIKFGCISCGTDLEAQISGGRIMVEVCPMCLEEANSKGYKEAMDKIKKEEK